MTDDRSRGRGRLVTILRWVFGVYFVFVGVMHFVVPDGLPDLMSWMYELSDGVHYVAGTAEILGGLGLILPGLTGIRPELTPLAAVGLTVVMLSAVVWHATREEWAQIGNNLVLAGVLAYIAYATWESMRSAPRVAGEATDAW